MKRLHYIFLGAATLILWSCALLPQEEETTVETGNTPTPNPTNPTNPATLPTPTTCTTRTSNFGDYTAYFRLLTQATFGADCYSLARIQTLGIEGWIDEQLNMESAYENVSENLAIFEDKTWNNDTWSTIPNKNYDNISGNWPTHLERTIIIAHQVEPETAWYGEKGSNIPTELSNTSPEFKIFNKRRSGKVKRYQMAAWWDNVLGNPSYPKLGKDQLRQRVAYSLSQLLVTSDREFPLDNRAEGLAYYYDLLAKNAFGNYRDLLGDVARSPTMGIFLSHQGNRKANKAQNIRPDENFAREVMQLFTIGLQELNLDGSANADNDPTTYPDNGSIVSTFTEEDIEELAKVFTGWDLVGNKHPGGGYVFNDNESFGRAGPKDGDYTQQMEFTPYFHEDELDPYYDNGTDNVSDEDGKVTVLGTEFDLDHPDKFGNPSGLDKALDVIFAHSNVGPFVSKHLVKSLVTSNPSSKYIADVAQVFNDNGSGVKGDLKSVIRKILTHEEARGSAYLDNPDFGKAKEPVLVLSQLLRANHVKPLAGWKNYDKSQTQDVYWISNLSDQLGYAPMRSVSQFNFFSADYQPPNFSGRVAPELEIQNDQALAELSNLVNAMIEQSKQYIEINKETTIEDYGKSKDFGSSPLLQIDFSEEYELLRSSVYPDNSSQDFSSDNRNFAVWQNDNTTEYQRLLNGFNKLLDKVDEKLYGKTMTQEIRDIFMSYFTTDLGRRFGNPVDKLIILQTITDTYRFVITSPHFMAQK